MAFSTAPQSARYVPVRHAGMHSGPQVTLEQALGAAQAVAREPVDSEDRPRLEERQRCVLARHGVTLRGLSIDTMLAGYLLDATRSGHPLETSALEYLGYKALLEEDVCGKGAKATSLVDTPPAAALTFAAERADLSLATLATLLADARSRSNWTRCTSARAAAGAGARRRSNAPASGSMWPRWPSVAADRSGAGYAQRADFRHRRRGVQHQFAAAAVENSVRQAAAAGAASAT